MSPSVQALFTISKLIRRVVMEINERERLEKLIGSKIVDVTNEGNIVVVIFENGVIQVV